MFFFSPGLIIFEQFNRRISSETFGQPDNDADEVSWYEVWGGRTRDLRWGLRERNYTRLNDDGTITITQSVDEFAPAGAEKWEWTTLESRDITYDRPLDDVVLLKPTHSSLLHKYTNGKEVLMPAFLLHFELDERDNDDIKFSIEAGVNVASL